MSESKNPAVVVALKEGGEFKCDLLVEERPIPQHKDDEVGHKSLSKKKTLKTNYGQCWVAIVSFDYY